jgi:manganese/zinc/iron transport system permease protein
MVLSDNTLLVLASIAVSGLCSLVGLHLILRRQAMYADALSHSVLPGLVVAFVLSESLGPLPLLLGALAAGLFTSVLTQSLKDRASLREDTSLGIVFSGLFALGVLMLGLFAGRVHLDASCVLFGELAFLPLENAVNLLGVELPEPLVLLLGTFAVVAAICLIFHRALLASAFHEEMAHAMGLPVKFLHHLTLTLAAAAIIACFESVGAILVIGLLVIPPSFGRLFSSSFRGVLLWSWGLGLVTSVVGVPLAFAWDTPISAMLVSLAFALFALAFAAKWLWEVRR